jgi:hypothetical protein
MSRLFGIRKGSFLGTAVLLALPAAAQESSFREERFHGRQAYVLENAQMRVSALRGAGHIAEIRLKSDDPKKNVNPMRVPHFPTIEPWEYDPAKHDRIYGGGTNRWLMSGYMGHLLNFPTFGGPSGNEARSGLGNHGEALAVEWKKDGAEAGERSVRLWYSAHLPKTEYNVGRILTLPGGETVLYIEEWVENLLPFDRPAHWVQHATFGPPFVEAGKNVLDMSATKGQVRGDTSGTNSLAAGDVEWPNGKSFDEKPVSLREMQTRQGAGTYAGYLMDPGRERNYFTMFHKDFNVLIGYIWKTKDFPWIGDWQENHRGGWSSARLRSADRCKRLCRMGRCSAFRPICGSGRASARPFSTWRSWRKYRRGTRAWRTCGWKAERSW